MCRPAPVPPPAYGMEPRNHRAIFSGLLEVEIEGSNFMSPDEHRRMLMELQDNLYHLPPNIRLIVEDAVGRAG